MVGKARWAGSGITRLALSLPTCRASARLIARRHKSRFTTGWRDVQKAGRSAREKARELQLLIEGANILRLISGDAAMPTPRALAGVS